MPGLLVCAGIALALGLVELDVVFYEPLRAKGWQALLSAGEEGARGMLAAIAGTMITVAGVAFSITIVTLSLASTQYTPRILRNFMRDRANQFVLGIFVAVFTYCPIASGTMCPSLNPAAPLFHRRPEPASLRTTSPRACGSKAVTTVTPSLASSAEAGDRSSRGVLPFFCTR